MGAMIALSKANKIISQWGSTMKLLPMLIVALILNCSCSRNSIGESDVTSIIGQHLKCDFSSLYCANSISYDTEQFAKSDFTLVAFVDSDDCTGCSMKLKLWADEISKLNSVADVTVDFVMIVESRRPIDVINICGKEKFEFPVFADTHHQFRRENTFLEKCRKNTTFLVDAKGDIVVFGNPLLNPKIHNLFMNVVEDCSDFTSSDIASVDTWVKVQLIKEPTDTFVFSLYNHSDKSRTINKILSSCDCFSTIVEQDSIGVGQNIELKIVSDFENERSAGWKQVYLYLDSCDSPLSLKIRSYEMR